MRVHVSLVLFMVIIHDSWAGIKERTNTEISPSYSIGSALRYLSKAVFAKALADNFVDGVDDNFRLASLQDSSDCIKRLVCELSQKQGRSWDEELIMSSIPARIDYRSTIIQFELAADLGSKQPQQCSQVYSRCSFNAQEVMTLMRQRGTSLDIPTDDEYDCTVLFLWNKKFIDNPKETTESSVER